MKEGEEYLKIIKPDYAYNFESFSNGEHPKLVLVINNSIDNYELLKEKARNMKISYDEKDINKENHIFNVMAEIHSLQITKTANEIQSKSVDKDKIYLPKNFNFAYHYFIDKNGNIYKGRNYDIPIYNLDIYEEIEEKENVFTKRLIPSDSIRFKDTLVILTEENTSQIDCTNETYVALKQLLRSIIDDEPLIKDYFCYSEINFLSHYLEYNNPGIFFKFNELRSSVSFSLLDVVNKNQFGNNIYTYGKRDLKYNAMQLMNGNDVYMLQYMLKNIDCFDDYPNYIPNGIYDLYTYAAVKKFQERYYLTESNNYTLGFADRNTLKYIRDTIYKEKVNNIKTYNDGFILFRTLYYNENDKLFGNDVEELQKKLKNILDYSIVISGIFDKTTETNVRKFQRIIDIEDDGMVGPITWQLLNNSKLSSLKSNITENSKGISDNIRILQRALNIFSDYYSSSYLDITGIYDYPTISKIKSIVLNLSEQQRKDFGYNDIENECEICTIQLYNYIIDQYYGNDNI